tara:strand:+ start:7614 stop:7838 length:225 start_codon:yes stop_codon:yes gene_type:complete
MSEQKEVQSKMMMAVVCWFLGALGIHRMMMGYEKWWIMPIVTILTCGIGGVWAFYDLIMILTGKMGMADGRELT